MIQYTHRVVTISVYNTFIIPKANPVPITVCNLINLHA